MSKNVLMCSRKALPFHLYNRFNALLVDGESQGEDLEELTILVVEKSYKGSELVFESKDLNTTIALLGLNEDLQKYINKLTTPLYVNVDSVHLLTSLTDETKQPVFRVHPYKADEEVYQTLSYLKNSTVTLGVKDCSLFESCENFVKLEFQTVSETGTSILKEQCGLQGYFEYANDVANLLLKTKRGKRVLDLHEKYGLLALEWFVKYPLNTEDLMEAYNEHKQLLNLFDVRAVGLVADVWTEGTDEVPKEMELTMFKSRAAFLEQIRVFTHNYNLFYYLPLTSFTNDTYGYTSINMLEIAFLDVYLDYMLKPV